MTTPTAEDKQRRAVLWTFVWAAGAVIAAILTFAVFVFILGRAILKIVGLL